MYHVIRALSPNGGIFPFPELVMYVVCNRCMPIQIAAILISSSNSYDFLPDVMLMEKNSHQMHLYEV